MNTTISIRQSQGKNTPSLSCGVKTFERFLCRALVYVLLTQDVLPILLPLHKIRRHDNRSLHFVWASLKLGAARYVPTRPTTFLVVVRCSTSYKSGVWTRGICPPRFNRSLYSANDVMKRTA